MLGAQAVGVANPVSSWLTDDHLLSLLEAAQSNVLIVPSHAGDPQLHSRLAALISTGVSSGRLPGLTAVLTLPQPVLPAPGPAASGEAPDWPVPVADLQDAAAGRAIPCRCRPRTPPVRTSTPAAPPDAPSWPSTFTATRCTWPG